MHFDGLLGGLRQHVELLPLERGLWRVRLSVLRQLRQTPAALRRAFDHSSRLLNQALRRNTQT